MAFSVRLRDLMSKYGKVALGVHLSVSAASITGIYVAIQNNVDVQSLFEKVGLSSTVPHHQSPSGDGGASIADPTAVVLEDQDQEFHPPTAVDQREQQPRHSNRTAELAASSGGALALAILCNKALFPIRVPITIGLTPPIARFLARRKVIKNV